MVLPEKGHPRDRWLTRAEVARLLWACWRTREIQTAYRGAHKGTKIQTDRYPLRPIGRFIIISLYTGTRPGAVMSASFVRGPDKSFVDLEHQFGAGGPPISGSRPCRSRRGSWRISL